MSAKPTTFTLSGADIHNIWTCTDYRKEFIFSLGKFRTLRLGNALTYRSYIKLIKYISLAKVCVLDTLDLATASFGTLVFSFFEALGEYLEHIPSLKTLIVGSRKLVCSNIIKLLDGIGTNHHLTTLNLNGNYLHDDSFDILSSYMMKTRNFMRIIVVSKRESYKNREKNDLQYRLDDIYKTRINNDKLSRHLILLSRKIEDSLFSEYYFPLDVLKIIFRYVGWY